MGGGVINYMFYISTNNVHIYYLNYEKVNKNNFKVKN